MIGPARRIAPAASALPCLSWAGTRSRRVQRHRRLTRQRMAFAQDVVGLVCRPFAMAGWKAAPQERAVPGTGKAGIAAGAPAGEALRVAVDIVQRAFQRLNAAAERAGTHLLVRVGKHEPVLREGAQAVPAPHIEAAGRIGQRERGNGGRGFLWIGGRFGPPCAGETEIDIFENGHATGCPRDGRGRFLRAGFRGRNLDAARRDDDQPAGGGLGRAQQADDSAPDPARHLVRAAHVQPGIDEQHRDDAQERIAVAGDGSGPVESVGLRGGHGARVGEGGGAVDRIARFSHLPAICREAYPTLRHPRA